jgi:apolipoprotein N-acyltransferase
VKAIERRSSEARSDAVPSRAPASRRFAIGIALSALSGLFAVWSLEDFHVELLAWVAFVPAIVAQHRVLPKRWSGLALGIAVGMLFQGYMGPGLSNADLPWYFYTYGLWIGLLVAIVAWRSRGFQDRTSYRFFLISAPVAWVALEFLRSTQSETLAATWGNIAYALYERPVLLQPISVTGIHGINLLVLVVNWAIAGLVIAWLDRRNAPTEQAPLMSLRVARNRAIAVAAVLAVWTISGVAMMRSPVPTLRAAAIQPGAGTQDPSTGEWTRLSDEEELATDIEQTRYAASQGAELAVWREGGLGMDLREPEVNEPIRELAEELEIYIAAGWGGTYDGLRLNEVATFSPDGKFLGTYGKSHPGTFAGDFSDRRSEYIVYRTPFGGLGSIICYDLDFTDSARAVAKRGANVLAVSSNDVPGITEKHYAHLVFRSIETRLPTVKADGQFDSSVIDPYGRIVDRHLSKQGSRATLIADIPTGSGDTLYVRFGDWLGWLCVAGLIAVLMLGLVTRFRRRA